VGVIVRLKVGVVVAVAVKVTVAIGVGGEVGVGLADGTCNGEDTGVGVLLTNNVNSSESVLSTPDAS